MERQIRETKRTLAGADAGRKNAPEESLQNVFEENFNGASIKLKKQESDLKEFLHQTGLDRQREREQVSGFGRSQAQKAVWVKKKVDIKRQNDIIKEEIRTAGNLPKAAKIHLNPTPTDVKSLSYDENHINQRRRHNVTKEQATKWINEAKISVTVWNGRYERYYGVEGTAYVDKFKSLIRTAYSSKQYSDDVKAMLEVILKHGL